MLRFLILRIKCCWCSLNRSYLQTRRHQKPWCRSWDCGQIIVAFQVLWFLRVIIKYSLNRDCITVMPTSKTLMVAFQVLWFLRVLIKCSLNCDCITVMPTSETLMSRPRPRLRTFFKSLVWLNNGNELGMMIDESCVAGHRLLVGLQ